MDPQILHSIVHQADAVEQEVLLILMDALFGLDL